jgi:cytochrome c553
VQQRFLKSDVTAAVTLKKLHHLLIGVAAGVLVIVPIGVFGFVESGVYNVGASHRHTKFTSGITHDTMIHSVGVRARGISPPSWTSSAQLLAGFCGYETHCVACHGAAAVARERWVAGMEPSPPYLLDVTQRFTPAQLFWIVKNGIKMTGMPAWDETMSDREMWNVVAWLEASRNLPPQAYLRLRNAGTCRSGPLSPVREPASR